VAPDSVARILVQRAGVPGVFRGTTTQFGITVAFFPDDALDDWSREGIAHELTHLWIGRRFPDERLIWFKEGFTEYLALWTAGRGRRRDPRLVRPAPGRVRRRARRDASGPGAAAHRPWGRQSRQRRPSRAPRLPRWGAGGVQSRCPIAQRGQGHARQLHRQAPCQGGRVLSESEIRATAEAMGAGAEFRAAVDSVPLASPWPALRSVGFVIGEESASLVALGIAADAPGCQAHLTMGPAMVRSVDPSGPSAAADIVPGDTVVIRSDRRQNPPTHDVAITSVSLGRTPSGRASVLRTPGR
jgi:hypothetical protein